MTRAQSTASHWSLSERNRGRDNPLCWTSLSKHTNAHKNQYGRCFLVDICKVVRIWPVNHRHLNGTGHQKIVALLWEMNNGGKMPPINLQPRADTYASHWDEFRGVPHLYLHWVQSGSSEGTAAHSRLGCQTGTASSPKPLQKTSNKQEQPHILIYSSWFWTFILFPWNEWCCFNLNMYELLLNSTLLATVGAIWGSILTI